MGTAVDNDISWRGCSMTEIHRNLSEFELEHVPPVRPTEIDSVLYHFPIRCGENEAPNPLKGQDKWDSNHVRLPCSHKSQYPVVSGDGTVTIKRRWDMVEQALLRPIKTTKELELAILSYNSKYRGIWNFRSLHKLFDEELDESESESFFNDLLPKIIRLALRLPSIVQSGIPLMKQGQNRSISLSQLQVSSLLANGFLCTFPRRNTSKRKSEYITFPQINFNNLFQSTGRAVIEKIKCICHYFRRVCEETPTGVVTFIRRSISSSELPNWSQIGAPLAVTPLHVTSSGTIEDQGIGLLQVDFANKYLGGGVLGSGCVQEEIRFSICPELLVGKLFTECLRPNEAVIMVGCERYSNYRGYANSFEWIGNFEDETPLDGSRRRQIHIVAIDALPFTKSVHQYREELMLRELNKAYVGFFHPLQTIAPGVASGNWGCGAFKGDASLKAVLQIMACTVAKRPLAYFTFGDEKLRDAIHRIHTFFIENNVLVKDLWRYLKRFQEQKLEPGSLYDYIYVSHSRDNNGDPGPTSTSGQQSSKPIKKQQDTQHRTNVQRKVTEEKKGSDNSVEGHISEQLLPTSEDDDMLEEAARRVESSALNNKSESDDVKVSSSCSTKTVEKKMKQTTLLEMLDRCYTRDSPLKRRREATNF